MAWIDGILVPTLNKIKQKFQEIDGLFRGTDTVRLDDTPRRVKAFTDVMIHGNSIVLEKTNAIDEEGYFVLDADGNRVGMLAKSQTVGPDTTLYSMVELTSNGAIVQSGTVNDVSTSILITKTGADANSAGLVVAIVDENGDKITPDIPFFTVSNGYGDNENIFSVHQDYIHMPNQGQNYGGSETAAFIPYFDTTGKLFTGSPLSGLNTTSKDVVGAINELKAEIDPNAGKSVVDILLTDLNPATTYTLVPSPGANKLISPERVIIDYKLISTYTETDETFFGVGIQALTELDFDVPVPTSGFTTQVITEASPSYDYKSNLIATVVDKALVGRFDAARTGGSSSMRVTIFYKIIDVQPVTAPVT